jgi:hypothetical protein
MVLAFSALLIVSDFDLLRSHGVFRVVSGVAALTFFVGNIALQMRDKVGVAMKTLPKE